MDTRQEKKNTEQGISRRRLTMSGIVTSDKMKDTIVVKVSRFVKHPKYGKYVSISKKFKAHDVGNTKKIGDKVMIEECKPISKDKHFKVVEVE
nr:30S ribosomal protein S17 [uncultured archaeon]